MATWARNERIFDTRDAQLLELLRRGRMMSTSQLQKLARGREPLGALVDRLARLAAGGWVKCLPRVPTSSGSVAVWHRADEPLPEALLPLAAELVRLNDVVAALASGQRALEWTVALGAPPTVKLQSRELGTIHLLWGSERDEVRAACLRFGSALSDPEAGVTARARPEALVLCEDAETVARLQREIDAWKARFPEPAPVRVALAEEGVRVLRALLQGEVLVASAHAEPPVEEIPDDARERIAAFLDLQG